MNGTEVRGVQILNYIEAQSRNFETLTTNGQLIKTEKTQALQGQGIQYKN